MSGYGEVGGAFGPSGPTVGWSGLGGQGATGATGPAGGTALAQSGAFRHVTTQLDRGWEPSVQWATISPQPDHWIVHSPVDLGPAAVVTGCEGLAFIIAVAALLLAKRMQRHGVRLLMLVFVPLALAINL